jgi:hypothetical protein
VHAFDPAGADRRAGYAFVEPHQGRAGIDRRTAAAPLTARCIVWLDLNALKS